jgi:hypothetical protein
MSHQVLSEPVTGFLREHVRDVADLQLLVVVAGSAERWWDATAAARALVIDVTEARELLEHLAAHNLLEIRVTGDVRYQFRPGSEALCIAARAFLTAYRDHPFAVWRAVAGAGSTRSIRDFADAFRIRRDGGR